MITIHPLLLGIFLYMKEKTSNSSYLQQHQVLQEDRGLRGIRRGPFKRREMRLRECANCQWWDLISPRSSAESTAGNLAGDLGPAPPSRFRQWNRFDELNDDAANLQERASLYSINTVA